MEPEQKKRLFEEIYGNHLLKVVFFANHYTGNKEEAECVAHEVFVSLWNRMNEIDLTKDILPYLITITKNRCLNIIKARKVKAKYNEHAKLVHDVDSINRISLEEPVSKLYSSDLGAIINKSITQMTKTVRDTFILSRYKKLSYEEISQLEGISQKAVEYRIMSALRILRKNCKDYLA